MKLHILLYISAIIIASPLLTAMGGQFCINEHKSFSPVFIENRGQWDAEVKYLAKLKGMYCWFTAKGIIYDLYNKEKINSISPFDRLGIGFNLPGNDINNKLDEIINRHVLKMEFCGQEDNIVFEPQGKLEAYYNYFIGNDSTKWASFVPLYNGIVIKNIYNGIDWHYYFDNNRLRFDIIINPGADLSQIKMLCTGQDGMSINEKGELTLQSGVRQIELNKIFAYQIKNGIKQEINCKFVTEGSNIVKIEAESYNKDLALIIDPLIYSTYIGDDDEDEGHAIVSDSNGNAYLTGYTGSLKYPVTSGSEQTTYGGGDYDCFITKLNPNGTTFSYTTFLGGDTTDCGYGIGLDKSGNIYVTGQTASENFPATMGAFQTNYGGGDYDCFVTKINSTGSALVYSTFVGGSGDDFARGLTLDTSNNAYIAGYTDSQDYPATNGAVQTIYSGGEFNCLITKLNPSGSALVYSTFFGGSSSDFALGIALDSMDDAYITGRTQSKDYPTTPDAFQISYNGGNFDSFITKLNPSGTNFDYSTYLGGTGDDWGNAIALDTGSNIYVTGNTNSTDYPITNGAYQTKFGGGSLDCFVTKISQTGSANIYSTFIGGSGSDYANSIVLDTACNAYIGGETGSNDYPVTQGAFQTQFSGGAFDCIVTKLNAQGSAISYSTFIGGLGDSWINAIAIDSHNIAYATGETNSPNFPTSKDAFQTTFGGDWDCFVTKLSTDAVSSVKEVNESLFCTINCYPNPFSSTENIEFYLPFASHCTIKIYNSIGTLIQTLEDNVLEAGNHKLSWEPASQSLPEGVYFCEIIAGGYREVIPIIYYK